ncbi:BTB/POZ domain-containing protein 19 isoform X3 [Anas platyrhynchos]|uniref:BTB/POZ domain-containing protein 19 isoform X3 n=1 Tax=Anas platyrhynchos TaxID=8839 RepID=UPI003AF1F57F
MLPPASFPWRWAVLWRPPPRAGQPPSVPPSFPPSLPQPPSSSACPHGPLLLGAAAGRGGRLHRGPAHPGQQPPVQGPFVLGNVQPDVFLAVIEFLYTNSVSLNSHIALEVLTSSVEYGLQDLCKLCVEFIKDTLSVEQVCEALQAAVTYGQVDLQQHCLAFIESCTAAVVRTRGFHELSDTVLARVLRSDRLAVDELDLVQAVREWAHVSSAVLGRPVPEVAALPVRELRLPLLAPSELATLESHNQRDLLIPVESIAAAWRSHALRRGSGVPPQLCRPRRGTRPRDHHRHLDSHAK